MDIPTPLKTLFDSVPLSRLSPVRQHTNQEKLELSQRHHRYSVKQSSTHFTLCVYNVYQEDSTYLATDPLCLTAELALGRKNNITLPKLNNDHMDKTRDSVCIVSHHVHPEGHLPLYIEQDKKRITRDYTHVQEALMQSVESSTETMLISLVDCVFYDAWLHSLLFECDAEIQALIYTFDSTPKHHLVNRWALGSVLSSLCTRNGFHLRNPHTARIFQGDWTHVILSKLPKSYRGVQFEKDRSARGLKHALVNLENILSKKGEAFSQPVGLLDLKLASYITLWTKFMPHTPTYSTIKPHELLIAHARHVLKQCS